MKRGERMTSFVITGLLIFGISSCGGANERQTRSVVPESKQYAQMTSSGDYDEEGMYDIGLQEKTPNNPFKGFNVYTDGRAPDNHYIPSGYMGDYSDIKMDTVCFEEPHSGTTCIKVTYTNNASQGARWAGVYWQNPANNWGDKKGGFDLTGARKLTFWARGEKGGERVEEFKMGGISGLYPDSDVAGIGPVVLKKEWQKYEIDLAGKDLAYISGGFCWATNLDVNPEGAVFYLDDIKYE